MENGGDADDDRHSILGEAKQRILGEMKHQFNSHQSGASSSENDLHIDEDGGDAEEDGGDVEEDTTDTDRTDETKKSDESESNEEKPSPTVSPRRPEGRKPAKTSKKMKMTTRSSSQRPESEGNSESEAPKRSTRRRSKDCNESVLQSAIARKEKSYNETSKPQRLTRQLKPTQKILENIANASAAAAMKDKPIKKEKEKKRKLSMEVVVVKKRKRERVDSDGSPEKCRRSGRLTQNTVVNSESDSDTKVLEENGLPTNPVEGQEAEATFSSHLDADSATAQLIASRLCVCTSPTKYTPLSESSICCNALDSISNRLIGCNNAVNKESAWMLRPSTRVPYMVLCRLHRARLRDHHCCAMCGIFCTQGAFLQCLNKHLYHKNCKLSIGALECCPHCGATDKHLNVTITMKTDAPPVYTATQCVVGGGTEKQPKAEKKSPKKRVDTKQNGKKLRKIELPPKFIDFCDIKEEKYDEDEELERQAENQKIKHFQIKAEVLEEDAPLIVCDDELEKLECLEKQLLAKRDDMEGDNSKHSIQELFEAVRNEMYAEVASLLGEKCVDLSQLIKYPEVGEENHDEAECGTVLHYAAMNGFVPIMHMLKIADIDLNLPDSESNTPLMVAVSHFQQEAVKYLTTAGSDVTAKGTDGMTALHLACKCGNLQATKELLLAAAHIKGYIDCQDDGGWTPLVWACEHNHVDVVKLLLAEGANPQIPDVEGNVALHWAAFVGSIAIVELILNFGGKVDSVNDQGDTPLHIASRHDNYNCVTIFVTRGASFALRNENNETALDCAPAGSKSRQTLVVNNKLKLLIKKK